MSTRAPESSWQVIRGGKALDTYDHHGAPADVLVRGGKIEAIGPPGLAAPDDARVVPAAGKLLIPGLVNAHTHSHYTLAKGLSETWTLELHLNAGGWMSAGRTEEDLYLGALLGAAEMLRHGCTSCYDMVLELPAPSETGLGAVARAYADCGMRAVISPAVADRTFWQSIPGLIEALPADLRTAVESIQTQPGEATIEACRRVLRTWDHDRDRVGIAIAPSIPLLCSDAFLVACRDLAQDFGVGLQTHLAESKVQAVCARRRYGQSLTAHLDRLGFLGPRLTAAHAIWLDADDRRRLADHGTCIAHNPASNLRLGNGLAAVPAMVEAGLDVGIGTDTSTCSDHLNMFETARLAALVSRVQGAAPGRWLTPTDVFRMATRGGARALGFPDCGRLSPGFDADIVLVDLESISYLPPNDLLSQLVFCENGEGVDGVMVGGRMVVEQGRITTIDYERFKDRVRSGAQRLHTAQRRQRATFEALSPVVGAFCAGLAREPHHVNRYLEPLSGDDAAMTSRESSR